MSAFRTAFQPLQGECSVENDSIRASGSNTLVDIWINGKLRAICVTRDAVDGYLHPDPPPATESARCEFVRTHLPEVVAAAKASLREGSPSADTVVVERAHLVKPGGVGERRSGDRRKGDRRKTVTPAETLPHGERRRAERRKTERRGRPKKDA
jgi:hypothetical protein